MAKITVTTDDGVVCNIWTERGQHAYRVDLDTTLPEPNLDRDAERRTWKFWVEDLLNEVRAARRQDDLDRQARSTLTPQKTTSKMRHPTPTMVEGGGDDGGGDESS